MILTLVFDRNAIVLTKMPKIAENWDHNIYPWGNVMITSLGDFRRFTAKKTSFFLKTNVVITIFSDVMIKFAKTCFELKCT
jgi:hypothetical protein